MSTFRCAIVTPSEQVFDDDVAEVEFPQWDGQRGVLKGAAPFVARLGTGRLRIRLGGGGEKIFLLNGGFAELHDDHLTLVADEIISKDAIVATEARKRLDDAIAAIAAPGTPDLEARERLERERQVASVAVALAEGR